MKALNGKRTFSVKKERSFSYGDDPMDQDKFVKKYPKAMIALSILTQAQSANPLKALLAVAEGKRKFDSRTIEKFLDAAEQYLNGGHKTGNWKYRTFSMIDSEKEFRDYAHKVMKKAHGDDYSDDMTNKVVDDLIKDNPDATWGELIGRLTSGLGE